MCAHQANRPKDAWWIVVNLLANCIGEFKQIKLQHLFHPQMFFKKFPRKLYPCMLFFELSKRVKEKK